MALIKDKQEREIQELRKVEEQIQSSRRRERIHHILIAGLGALFIGAVASHFCRGHHCYR